MNVQPYPHHVYSIPPALIRMIHTLVHVITVSKVMISKVAVRISMNVMVIMAAML